jgi:hypothetical protein
VAHHSFLCELLLRVTLMSRGEVEYDKVFSNISSFDFTINVSEGLLDYICLVRRHVNFKSRVGGTVTIPKEPIRGSYFGKCMCGLDTCDAVLCEHMAAVVISSRIPLLARENIMLCWWRTYHLKKQFPKEVLAECHVSIETMCEDGQPNNKIMYCPSWSALYKAGRLKKNERRKTVLEKAGATKVTRKPKLMTKFCQLCHKSSHLTNDCWELEKMRTSVQRNGNPHWRTCRTHETR